MNKPEISIDEFSKIDVQIGTVQSAERVPDTDKLIRFMIDFGPKPSQTESSSEANDVGEERDVRQIVSGIAAYVAEPESLIGRQLAFVTNLAPRMIRGLESNGMLFAVGSGESFAFLTPDRAVPPGTSAH
ncbi:MAG: hypothetical protein WCW36_00595 [Candidatus Paceibacterota bacterium]|jgi:methionyl-tRNA synthetase